MGRAQGDCPFLDHFYLVGAYNIIDVEIEVACMNPSGNRTGKKIAVIGLGRSGLAAARYLSQQGAEVFTLDKRSASDLATEIDLLRDLKVQHECSLPANLEGRSLTGFDEIVVSPGVPLQLKPIQEAFSAGIPVTSELELALHALPPDLKVLAVTGTNGKTTTALLMHHLLKSTGKRSFLAGNIGTPLLHLVLEPEEVEFVVLELSSFQLEACKGLKPRVAICLNLTPDHMDRYEDFKDYAQAKMNLFRACTQESLRILSMQPTLREFAQIGLGSLAWVNGRAPLEGDQQGLGFDPQEKCLKGRGTFDVKKFRLFGLHNRENLGAAILALQHLGLSDEVLGSGIESFQPVPHRLEFVRKKDGVFFFNDSKGTNPAAVKASLESFKTNPVILIAGGKDKDGDFAPLLQPIRNKCKLLILIGEAKEKMNRALGDAVETLIVGTFEEAVLLGFQKSRSGDVVLLSPACASFDMFLNFEERGNYFKKLVQEL
jgi:UDP-N-acetylmuramoylalanine--D-glutamate ligase